MKKMSLVCLLVVMTGTFACVGANLFATECSSTEVVANDNAQVESSTSADVQTNDQSVSQNDEQ